MLSFQGGLQMLHFTSGSMTRLGLLTSMMISVAGCPSSTTLTGDDAGRDGGGTGFDAGGGDASEGSDAGSAVAPPATMRL